MSYSSDEETEKKKKTKTRKYDDDDEEEDEEETRQSKRRRKLGNYILDEAAVDEDDEDDEEYDEYEDNDLIDHPDNEAEVQDAIQHLQYDNRIELNNLDFQNDEEIEEYYRNRYEENDTDDFGAGDAMASAISQQKCLPGVKDPNLWQVSCTRGEEKNAILTLINKFNFAQYTSNPLQIKSAVSKDNVSGFIYIEAFKETHVKKAIEDIRHLSRGLYNLKMVSITEMTEVMKVLKSFKKLQPGQWVRIAKGLYRDDLAKVTDVEDAQNLIYVQLIPRIDTKKIRNPGLNNKRFVRPPQELMTRKKIADLGLDFTKSGDRIVIRSQEFDEKGYLYKSFKLTHVQSERVNPEMHELERFNETPSSMNLNSAMKKSLEDYETLFSEGDFVQVSKGFLKELKGKIISINGKNISVLPMENDLKEAMSFQPDELRKYFQPGNHVKVIQGKYEGETGIVVAYDAQIAVVMSDMNVSQFKVQPRHLQICNQTNSGLVSCGNFQIGDLIQIDPQTVGVVIKFEKNKMNVLTTTNKIVSLNTSSNLRKKNSARSCGLDADNNEIRIKDTVSVIDGIYSGQQGEVKHIYKSFSFLFNRNTTENAGYIAVKNRLLSKKSKGARGANDYFKVPSMVPQSPRLHDISNNNESGGGSDKPKFKAPHALKSEKKFVGSTARIIKGPLKGNIGIIKEIKADTATIELHSMFKTVKVVKENFALLNSSGRIIDSHFGAQSMRTGGATGGTSAWGGRTPNYGQTPMYANATPHYNTLGGGGETPRHSGDNIGARTPHVGGQTPRMGNMGSETPRGAAFDPAGATPAHHAYDMFDEGIGGNSSGMNNPASDQTPLSALSNSILDSPTVSGIYNQINTSGFGSEIERESPASMNLFSPVTQMPRTPAGSNFNIFTPATPGNEYGGGLDSSNPYMDSMGGPGSNLAGGTTPMGIPGSRSNYMESPLGDSRQLNSSSSSSMSGGIHQRLPMEHLHKNVIVLARYGASNSSTELKKGFIQEINGNIVSLRLPDEKRVISAQVNELYRLTPETGNLVIHFNTSDNTTEIGQCLTIDNDEVVVKIRSETIEPLKMIKLIDLEPYNE